MRRRGAFVAIEGVDASGKSTQSRLLAERTDALWTREPGDTPIGARLRAILLDIPDRPEEEPSIRCETLLMAADRAQHVHGVIRPNLLSLGRSVVSDRYYLSSIAYQGYGRNQDPRQVEQISKYAIDGLEPDRFVVIQVPVSVAVERLQLAQGLGDRLEKTGRDFLNKVHNAFFQLAVERKLPIIDGEGTVEEVQAQVFELTGELLLEGVKT